ncbi:hypothetical protein Tco_1017137 [Tanacetum coccineum]|uniref:Uncharacterized protein n=1 Tax=Tanacetum coccineum TaxID=301880 RepID=A0ABQ5FQM3_9ASTR
MVFTRILLKKACNVLRECHITKLLALEKKDKLLSEQSLGELPSSAQPESTRKTQPFSEAVLSRYGVSVPALYKKPRRPIRRIQELLYACMTRSSTKELFTPFKNPEREFCTFRKLFTTSSLDQSSSPEFDLFSDLEEHSEEEVAGTMTETMEEYMCKTRGDYGSGVTRPKIDAKDLFELKGQFLKELRDNTFSGSDHKDANEHIEKSRESLAKEQTIWFNYNLRRSKDEISKQAWEGFKELLMKCSQHYLTDMQEVILFYNGLEVLTRQILDSKGAIPTKTTIDAKIAIQEMAGYSQKWHNGTSKTRSTETSDG